MVEKERWGRGRKWRLQRYTGIGYHLVPRIVVVRPKIYGFGRWKYARVPVPEGRFNDTQNRERTRKGERALDDLYSRVTPFALRGCLLNEYRGGGEDDESLEINIARYRGYCQASCFVAVKHRRVTGLGIHPGESWGIDSIHSKIVVYRGRISIFEIWFLCIFDWIFVILFFFFLFI